MPGEAPFSLTSQDWANRAGDDVPSQA